MSTNDKGLLDVQERTLFRGPHLPVSQYEIVWLNVSVNDLTAVDVFNHVEHPDSERDDESLGHHFFGGIFVEVNGILETMQMVS